VCGAALLRPRPAPAALSLEDRRWEVVARRTEIDGRGQAKVLLRLVDDMLAEIGRDPQDLGAVVVGTGPGTFTGVRIAVATARALSLALGIPVVGVSTLAALAAGAAQSHAGPGADAPDRIVPVVDARRGQVFYGLYAAPGNRDSRVALERRYTRSAAYGVCDRDSLGVVLDGAGREAMARTVVVAEERDVVGDLPAQVAFVAAQVEPETLVAGQGLLEEPGERPQGSRLAPWLLHALGMAESAMPKAASQSRAQAGVPGTPEAVTPIYVRPPDADIHILKMRDPFARAGERPGPAGEG